MTTVPSLEVRVPRRSSYRLAGCIRTAPLKAARLARDRGVLGLSATYEHPSGDWKSGGLRFATTGESLRLAGWQAVRDFREGLDAQLLGSKRIRETRLVVSASPATTFGLRRHTGLTGVSGLTRFWALSI